MKDGIEHESEESQPVKASQRGGQSFIVSGESAETSGPGKGTLDHPSPWKKDKSSFGDGVPTDEIKAVEWYQKSADQGYAAAQFNLGFRYANGRGVPKDDIQAVEWYKKTAEQGDAKAQF